MGMYAVGVRMCIFVCKIYFSFIFLPLLQGFSFFWLFLHKIFNTLPPGVVCSVNKARDPLSFSDYRGQILNRTVYGLPYV